MRSRGFFAICALFFLERSSIAICEDADRCLESSSKEADVSVLIQQKRTEKRIEKRLTTAPTKPYFNKENAKLGDGKWGQWMRVFWIIAVNVYLSCVVFAWMTWWFLLSKPKKDDEEKDDLSWREATHDDRFATCALALFSLGCTMFFRLCLKFFIHPECVTWKKRWFAVELVILLIIFVLSARCWLEPCAEYYWPSIICFLFYMPSSTLPPFSASCVEMQHCKISNQEWHFANAMYHHDCSLQGQTAQQMFLNVLLLSPWLLPELQNMQLLWIWIFTVYGFWSVAYFRYSADGEASFNNLDVMVRLALLCATLMAATTKKHYLQLFHKKRYESDRCQERESERLYGVLRFMLPEHVIWPLLRDPEKHIAEDIDIVSVLFVMIEDFDKISKDKTTKEVLKFLREHYTQFDEICTRNHVTKLETVGEEYVCCVGVTPDDQDLRPCGGHAKCLQRLLLVASEILQLQSHTVRFRMGINTGPIVAGVIGKKLPRFRLFGDTMNTAARMMQRGISGRVQFGEATYDHLDLIEQALTETVQEKVEMKGKGEVQTFLFGMGISSTVFLAGEHERKSEFLARRWLWLSYQLMNHHGAAKGGQGIVNLADVLLGRREAAPLHPTKSARSFARRRGTNLSSTVYAQRHPRSAAFFGRATNMTQQARELVESQQLHFTPELEEEWQKTFHEQHVCKHLINSLSLYFLFGLMVTVLEILWNCPSPRYPNSGWNLKHALYRRRHRLPIFFACRFLILLIIAALRYVFSEFEWVWAQPKVFQWCLVAASCVIAVACFFSYDVMIAGVSGDEERKVQAPFDQIFSLVFVLMFFCIIRMFTVSYRQSLAFIPLAMFILALTDVESITPHAVYSGVYMPLIGQVMFVFLAISSVLFTRFSEESMRARFLAERTAKDTDGQVEMILGNLMPPLVLKEVQSKLESSLPQHYYESATVVQSDLCGFTKLASECPPEDVVRFISDLFGCFDKLTDIYGVYKVETVGDAYIAAQAEPPLTEKHNPLEVIQFGIAMVHEVMGWSQRTGKELQCRVGVHHGACMGGIVDSKMYAYHLFGDLMRGLEILESTAPKGGVQVSQACREAVLKIGDGQIENIEFLEVHGDHLLTSKGEVHGFHQVGGRTFVLRGLSLSTSNQVEQSESRVTTWNLGPEFIGQQFV